MIKKTKILQITPFFYPNVGGVETHLVDLIKSLTEKYSVGVITYQALVGEKKGKRLEKNKNLEIVRISWFRNLYYKTLKSSFLHFVYLTPRLLIAAITYCLKKKSRFDIFHAHGINAAYVGAILKKIFGKPLVVSMHVEFNFSHKRRITSLLLWPLTQADKILTLTNASRSELIRFGIPENKIKVYSYWVDQEVFKPINKDLSRKRLKISKDKFVALFVGRLAKEKGIEIVLSLAEKLRNIEFIVAGSGDWADIVRARAETLANLRFVGKIENKDLPLYYSASDVLLVPSLVATPKPTFEEGVPRVIIESLSCGTPVIGTDNGGIREVLEAGVGVVSDSTPDAYLRDLKELSSEKGKLQKLADVCRKFAVRSFSPAEAKTVSEIYEDLNTLNELDGLLENTGDMALKRRTKWIIANLDLKTGDKILDVGCGDGFYLHILSNLNKKARLTGTDFDVRALGSARKNLQGRNIRLVAGDLMKKLPFASNSFNKIIMSEVTEHLPDDVRGLKEVYRVLKPGGLACVTVPHANYPFLWDPVNWVLEHLFDTHFKSGFWAGIWNQHERLYEKDQIGKVIEKAGFDIKEQRFVTWWCLPFNHYLINIGARILAKGGRVGLSEGSNKFVSNDRRSLIPDIYFSVTNIVDRLNDLVPIRSGVSVVTSARKPD